MSILTWAKIGGAAFIVIIAVLFWWSYDRAIKAETTMQATIAAQNTRLLSLESDEMQHAKTLAALTSLTADHNDKIQANTDALSKRTAYITKTYAGATSAQKSVLDTDLPQFRCVYDGTCETPGPVVPTQH